mmetsp:Transcript_4568/g.5003  ORF Transcript_4568/g.5003 Transcript_4568/m.5003 type:complete len:196 (+) Transcript_4568:169-756(+)
MVPLKILTITEKIVFVNDVQHQRSLQPPPRSSGATQPHKRPTNTTTTFLYDITFSLDGGHTLIRIERPKTDIVCLVQALVLYFPSYQFSAQTLFQPPDQYIRDLLELQQFLNRILSIDVGSRIIQYPKIISFFDPVFGRSVVQRSLMRQNLRAMSNLERAIDGTGKRLETVERTLSQCIDLLQKLQVTEDKQTNR